MTDRICPVKGCFVPIRRDRNMCLAHWRRVPKDIQEEVWATWRMYQDTMKANDSSKDEKLAAISRLRWAKQAANDAVEAKEGRS